MSTLNTWTKYFRSTAGKIVMALAFILVIGEIFLGPAFGQDYERRQGQQNRGGYARGRHDEGRWRGRERYDERRWRARAWHNERRWRAYRPYGYAAPYYYEPPPVVYPPYQSPGISLFFPLHIR